MAYQLTDEERREMMNALGLSMQKRCYRNHYVVTRGGSTHARWNSLEARGLVVSDDDGTHMIRFHVTNKGVKALGVDDRMTAEYRVPDQPVPA